MFSALRTKILQVLLCGKIKDFELAPNEDKSITELLAFISSFQSVKNEVIYKFYAFLINNDYEFDTLLKKLDNKKLIRIKEDFSYRSTGLGRAIAKSFLTVEHGLEIVEILTHTKSKSLIELALELEPLKLPKRTSSILTPPFKKVRLKKTLIPDETFLNE